MATDVLPLQTTTLPFAVLVVAMLVVEVFLLTQIVPRRGPRPSLARMIIGSSALVGSAGTLMALVNTTATASLDSYAVLLFAFNFMMVAPPGLWVISVIVYRDRTIDPSSWFWPVAVVAMATSAELLMGLLFVVADGPAAGATTVLAATLVSAWYLWSMVGAMVALTVWVPMPNAVRGPLLALSASGFVAPWVVADPIVGAALMAVAMAAVIVLFVRPSGTAPGAHRGVTLGVLAAFLAMNASGFAVVATNGTLAAVVGFGLVMSVAMVGEFLYLVRVGLLPAAEAPPASATVAVAPVELSPEGSPYRT